MVRNRPIVLSDGRYTLGVGVGGRSEDYRALGRSFEHRFSRLDAQQDARGQQNRPADADRRTEQPRASGHSLQWASSKVT